MSFSVSPKYLFRVPSDGSPVLFLKRALLHSKPSPVDPDSGNAVNTLDVPGTVSRDHWLPGPFPAAPVTSFAGILNWIDTDRDKYIDLLWFLDPVAQVVRFMDCTKLRPTIFNQDPVIGQDVTFADIDADAGARVVAVPPVGLWIYPYEPKTQQPPHEDSHFPSFSAPPGSTWSYPVSDTGSRAEGFPNEAAADGYFGEPALLLKNFWDEMRNYGSDTHGPSQCIRRSARLRYVDIAHVSSLDGVKFNWATRLQHSYLGEDGARVAPGGRICSSVVTPSFQIPLHEYGTRVELHLA